MGQYCFARRRLSASSSVTLPAAERVDGRPPPGRARARFGGRYCMAGQYGYVPLRRHIVSTIMVNKDKYNSP